MIGFIHHLRIARASHLALAACLLMLVVSSGCRMARPGGPFSAGGPDAPLVIETTSSVPQIVAAVNQNSARIHSYLAPNATFSVPGMPGLPLLRGNLALERPRRFRLRAGTALSGGEVDLGSNDELFWLWAKRNEPPAVYFARHDQHATGAARQMLPIEPSWIVDALGLVSLDPTVAYQGPFPRPDGTLELRSRATGPTGPIERVTVVEPTRAWVVEQHVYDQTGALLASSVAENFRYHPTAQASLPERVTVRVPAADLALVINTGTLQVNVPIPNPAENWALPYMEGYPQVDLGRSQSLPTNPSQPTYSQATPSQPINPLSATQLSVAQLPATKIVSPPAPGLTVAGDSFSLSTSATPLATTPLTAAPPAVKVATRPLPTVQQPVVQGIPSGGVALPPQTWQ